MLDNIKQQNSINAITLKKEDLLKGVSKSTGEDDVILITKKGKSIRFKEKMMREMGRPASGVHGIRLRSVDKVVGMDVVGTNHALPDSKKLKQYLLVVQLMLTVLLQSFQVKYQVWLHLLRQTQQTHPTSLAEHYLLHV